MKYMAFIHIDYDCGTFKKKHLIPLYDSADRSAMKALRKAEGIVAGMIEGYQNSKWTVTITENGFIGEKAGNINTYHNIIVKEN